MAGYGSNTVAPELKVSGRVSTTVPLVSVNTSVPVWPVRSGRLPKVIEMYGSFSVVASQKAKTLRLNRLVVGRVVVGPLVVLVVDVVVVGAVVVDVLEDVGIVVVCPGEEVVVGAVVLLWPVDVVTSSGLVVVVC